ncbi:uncharacterized protein LOC115887431 [Sitophilus oryzae]|uniref:Uncharacterized protein LOC115887431 n=1 Tax=Sitophilus oryzae TaxID=7048 RepID=A0A6J2YFI0_SITOR|nr:uncharacterized protein LOC115887431 [Sitophilus oryzae]
MFRSGSGFVLWLHLGFTLVGRFPFFKMSFEEGILIENIQNFPCIWNTKDKEYRNSLVVQNAWKSISFIMEESVESCQEAWKSLRSKYIRERKLITSMPSGSAAYSGNWPLFKSLNFLAPVIQTRRTSGNVKKQCQDKTPLNFPSPNLWTTTMVVRKDGSLVEETPVESQEEYLEETEDRYADSDDTSLNTVVLDRVPSPHESVTASRSSTPSVSLISHKPKTTKQGFKRKILESPSMDKLLEKCCNVGESINDFIKQSSGDIKKEIGNDNYYFALSLAESLSKIKSEKKLLKIKSKILLLLADELEDDD